MCRCTDIMFFQNPKYRASRQLLIPRIADVGTSFSPVPCQAWHGYKVTNAHRVEVEVGADGLESAPLSGAAAGAPPAGAVVVVASKETIVDPYKPNGLLIGKWFTLLLSLCTHDSIQLWKDVRMMRVLTRTLTYLTIRLVTMPWRETRVGSELSSSHLGRKRNRWHAILTVIVSKLQHLR
jgi:hypothetical protein